MNFQDLLKVEEYSWYLDVAFHNASKVVDGMRGSLKGDRLRKSKDLELRRIGLVRKVLVKHLTNILTKFPSIDGLPEFYNQLVKLTLDYAALKKSLGAVNWAVGKIEFFF